MNPKKDMRGSNEQIMGQVYAGYYAILLQNRLPEYKETKRRRERERERECVCERG